MLALEAPKVSYSHVVEGKLVLFLLDHSVDESSFFVVMMSKILNFSKRRKVVLNISCNLMLACIS